MKPSSAKYFESFIASESDASAGSIKTVRTLKIPILVDVENELKLVQASNCCTFFWNRITELRRDTDTKYTELGKILVQLKADTAELKLPCSTTMQKVSEQHQDNFNSFLTKHRNGDTKARTPGFKSTKYFYTQEYLKHFHVGGSTLSLAYGSKPKDWIKAKLVVELPENINLNSVEISRDRKTGQFYAHFTVKIHVATHNPVTSESPTLVFDPGCKTSLTGMRSDGRIIEYDMNPLRKLNMKVYKKIDDQMSDRDRLPCAQDLAKYYKQVVHFIGPQLAGYIMPDAPKMSRKYQRLSTKIDKGYELIRSRTKQNIHSLAKVILTDNKTIPVISVGNWSPPQTLADTPNKFANRAINRAVQNNNPVRALIGCLAVKAVSQRQKVVQFDERGTTRTCSHCHVVGDGVPTSQRVFTCVDVVNDTNNLVSPGCGFEIERDVNSTLNMHRIQKHGAWRVLNSLTEFKRSRMCIEPHSAVKLKTRKSLVIATRPVSNAVCEVPILIVESTSPNIYPAISNPQFEFNTPGLKGASNAI